MTNNKLEWIFDLSRGQVDEDEIREFVRILQERPLGNMARIAVESRHLPCGIPARADVLEALEGAKAYLRMGHAFVRAMLSQWINLEDI